ncbi:hypothetical protein VNO77_18288 [Canavalia gladiata]|uniref:Uncharacterized protein n=1 Tax=Canavalia gladiata TaxID=3824 RepID=A0AAN9LQI2_CANGL
MQTDPGPLVSQTLHALTPYKTPLLSLLFSNSKIIKPPNPPSLFTRYALSTQLLSQTLRFRYSIHIR